MLKCDEGIITMNGTLIEFMSDSVVIVNHVAKLIKEFPDETTAQEILKKYVDELIDVAFLGADNIFGDNHDSENDHIEEPG